MTTRMMLAGMAAGAPDGSEHRAGRNHLKYYILGLVMTRVAAGHYNTKVPSKKSQPMVRDTSLKKSPSYRCIASLMSLSHAYSPHVL